MRRKLGCMALATILVAGSGCVAVSAKNNRLGSGRQVVAVNGQVYVVDTDCGTVYEIELSKAKPMTETYVDEVEPE